MYGNLEINRKPSSLHLRHGVLSHTGLQFFPSPFFRNYSLKQKYMTRIHVNRKEVRHYSGLKLITSDKL
jgi:hypothetical protein